MQPEDKCGFEQRIVDTDAPRTSSDTSRCDGGRFLLGVVAGAAVGAGLAILFAPQSGQESREDIRNAGESLRDRTSETYEDARAAVEEWIAEARSKVDEARSRLDGAVEAGRLAAERKRAELDAKVDASLDA